MLIERLVDKFEPAKRAQYQQYRNWMYYGFMALALLFFILPLYAAYRYGWGYLFMFAAFFGGSLWCFLYAMRSKKALDELLAHSDGGKK